MKFLKESCINKLSTFRDKQNKTKKKRTNLPFSVWVQAKTFNCPCINLFNRKKHGSYGGDIFYRLSEDT